VKDIDVRKAKEPHAPGSSFYTAGRRDVPGEPTPTARVDELRSVTGCFRILTCWHRVL